MPGQRAPRRSTDSPDSRPDSVRDLNRGRAWPLGGFLALVAVVLAGATTPVMSMSLSRNLIVAFGVVALAVGVWRQRPEAVAGWWLTVAGAVLIALATMPIDAPTAALGVPTGWGDGVLGTGALLFHAAGLAVLGRIGGRPETADALDAAMIALAVFLVLFVLPIQSVLTEDTPVIAVAITVPVGALLLLTAAVRMMFAVGIPTVSTGLLLLAVAALIATVATVLLPVVLFTLPYTAPVTDAFWVSYSVLLGAAGLHPSLRRRAETRPRRPPFTLSARRTVMLLVLSVVTPLAWAFEIQRAANLGDEAVGVGFTVPVGVSLVLLLLLVARLALTAQVAERRSDELTHRSGELAQAVQEQQALQRQLRHQATHDPLTGLPNRLALLERIEWAFTRRAGSGEHALAVVDLDDFKDVNQSHGQPAADEALVATGRRLLETMPTGGTLARLSADQFAALLEDLPASQALAWAEEARKAVGRPYVSRGDEVTVSGSVGVRTVRSTGSVLSPSEALRDAELALQVAKARGKDQVVRFRPELRTTEAGRGRLSTGLRRALANQEFVVHYQPVIDLEDRRIVAVEALLRWIPPDGVPVPPDEFVPVAEETGLIGEIGAWTLRQACHEARGWYARRGIAVAVNVSGRQLEDPGFSDMVDAVLRDADLPGQGLIVEVTESSLVATTTVSTAMHQLHRLRHRNVLVAIDDFGTGYSSLAYMARLPADLVKIDKSFVQNPTPSAGAPRWDFVRAILQMVRTLQLEAVAEGVETPEQAQALRQLRCRLAQGYLFARPMPRAHIDRMITASQTLPTDLLPTPGQ